MRQQSTCNPNMSPSKQFLESYSKKTFNHALLKDIAIRNVLLVDFIGQTSQNTLAHT
jgi:hypothetical protein